MSWRLLIFSVLIFAAIATGLGLQAGEWLISHVPNKANVYNKVEDPQADLDQDGNPSLLKPFQPLVNGQQGVPSSDYEYTWRIDAESIEKTKKNEAKGVAQLEKNKPLISDRITQGSTSTRGQTTRIQPSQQGQGSGTQGWQAEFNNKMAQCRRLGFNDRPSCIRQTRQQYCGANNAWGKVADCPAQ